MAELSEQGLQRTITSATTFTDDQLQAYEIELIKRQQTAMDLGITRQVDVASKLLGHVRFEIISRYKDAQEATLERVLSDEEFKRLYGSLATKVVEIDELLEAGSVVS